MGPRHFLTLLDLEPAELIALTARASELKARLRAGVLDEPLKHRTLALVFEKSSTRTRVSFEAAMVQFGGATLFLSPRDTQLGRGEPIEDTARVLSRMVDAVAIRTFEHEKIERFAAYSNVPVINALTDRHHPCQLLADIQTFVEHRGAMEGRTVAWVGDGNNMCHSYIDAARQLQFHLRVASPEGYEPDPDLVAAGSGWVELMRDPRDAVAGADLVTTDVWASMGQEAEQAQRVDRFSAYQVNRQLMGLAAPDALFMHCLPAHRGEEVTEEVLLGPQSVVWDEAENRLHAQKALLELLLAP
ncbi:MAG: ornithine carbamoyltransferase [Gammaproteobacteria bacterium]|jgi:ornithine carbamoyltransferase|nr:ornithine carbamoyltransferase [Gammaproteobacteria bacterium]